MCIRDRIHTAIVKMSITLPKGTIDKDESLIDMLKNKEIKVSLEDLDMEVLEERRD